MLEAEAKLKIQDDILQKKFELAWSYILEAENMANPFKERRNAIADWREQAIVKVTGNETIVDKAINLSKIGLRSKDALHISCAIFAECSYFLTTDDKILNKNDRIEEIMVTDPIAFIKRVYL
jgi:hypothetical protein